MTLQLLGLSGSLRAASTNSALLRAAAKAARPSVVLTLFDGLGALPIFNPDLEHGTAPQVVLDLRRAVHEANGVVIACPEYAHGIPGGLKNALDWLVSGSEIPGKPVVFFHASVRSTFGRAALSEVLHTMSAVIVTEATVTVPLLGLCPAHAAALLATPQAQQALRAALLAFAMAIRRLRRAQDQERG